MCFKPPAELIMICSNSDFCLLMASFILGLFISEFICKYTNHGILIWLTTSSLFLSMRYHSGCPSHLGAQQGMLFVFNMIGERQKGALSGILWFSAALV